MKSAIRIAQRRLLDWSRKHSGYDEHMAKAHPPAGFILFGDVEFTIETVVFEGGQVHFRGRAGTREAGMVRGVPVILGTDHEPVLGGTSSSDMGVKTAASTSQFEYALNLENVRASSEEREMTAQFPPPGAGDAPQPA
jgi:hypothetical protein